MVSTAQVGPHHVTFPLMRSKYSPAIQSHRLLLTMFRATPRVSITPRVRFLARVPQRTFVSRNVIHQSRTRTLRSISEPRSDPTHWHSNSPRQGATRRLGIAATASDAVPSGQLGFVPDQPLATDLPIANADERKIAILWTPQNWSRLYVHDVVSRRWWGPHPVFSHHIWLRDHCRCPECFHPVTKQRLVNTFEVCGGRGGRGGHSCIHGV